MDNLNDLIDDLLEKKNIKINEQKKLENESWENLRNNLIELFLSLEPLNQYFSKLKGYTINEYHLTLHSMTSYSNNIIIKFDKKREEFVLYYSKFYKDKVYTFNELKHNPLYNFKEYIKEALNTPKDFKKKITDVVDFFKNELERIITILKKEVE